MFESIKDFIEFLYEYKKHKKKEKMVDTAASKLDVLKNKEIRKFQDERRKSIYETVELSDIQIKQIDDLYEKNYGEKIPYIWHSHYTAFTGNFDEKYFPELLYIPEFEAFMNPNTEYNRVFEDKNIIRLIATSCGVKVPKTLISMTNGVYRDADDHIITKSRAIKIINEQSSAFVKPTVDSSSGESCQKLDIAGGKDVNSNQTIEEIFSKLGNNFIAQEVIECDESISKLYPKSVNTFRIITYIWKNKTEVMPVIMRMGNNGAAVDNAHAGGIFIAIDNDGTLHDVAFTEFNDSYRKHPYTSITFKNYKINNFQKVIESAIKLHEKIPQVGVINWDFTIDKTQTPVLIEANIKSGSVWLAEMAHGCGAFGDKTEDVLRWLKLVKNCNESERENYYFGNGV